MINKRDVYRLYKILMGIRQGIYWESINFIKKSRYEALQRLFLQDMFELQDASNTFMQIFILLTSILVSVIQLLTQLYPKNNTYIIVSIILYTVIVIILFFVSQNKTKSVTKKILLREKKIESEYSDVERRMKESNIKDELISYQTELKLLEEIAQEYSELAHSGILDIDKTIGEIENIKKAYEDLKLVINDKIDMLEDFQSNDF